MAAAGVGASDHAFAQLGVTSPSLDNMQVFRSVETQTALGRRGASEKEKQAAIANGRAIYASFTPEKRATLKQKSIRYLAVTPVPAGNGSGRGLDLMVFDTSKGTVANKYVYTVKEKPEAGSSVRLDNYNALFTGL